MQQNTVNQLLTINDNIMSRIFINNIEVCLTLLNNFRGLRNGK